MRGKTLVERVELERNRLRQGEGGKDGYGGGRIKERDGNVAGWDDGE